jgi:lactoylglutathione lyase
MINKIGTVSIFVKDQDRAKAWYRDVLGFEVRRDEPMFPGAPSRWLEVAPKGADTSVVLYMMDENWEHYKNVLGNSHAMTFNVTDMPAAARDLKAKGVEFVMEPDSQPWGSNAIIKDSEGNSLILVELPKR